MRLELTELAARIRAVECAGTGRGPGCGNATPIVTTGWPAVDGALTPSVGDVSSGGLQRGRIHEWFGASAPLCIFSHLVWRALRHSEEPSGEPSGETCDDTCAEPPTLNGYAVWIGRHVWPYPHVLLPASVHTQTRGMIGRGGIGGDAARRSCARLLLARSFFVDPPDDETRLWAIDLALRCPAVAAVVADGSRLGMAETRRLQLAAESEGGALALLARPSTEMKELSAASTRWWVGPVPSRTGRPRWAVELLRAKGAYRAIGLTQATCHRARETKRVQAQRRIESAAEPSTASVGPPRPGGPTQSSRRTERSKWLLEWDHAQGVVSSSSDVVDRPRPAASSIGSALRARRTA